VGGQGGVIYLERYLRGYSDEEIWASLGGYSGSYDYFDFNKRPTEQ